VGAVLLCEPGSLLDTDSHGAWISVVFSHIYTPYKWRMKFCCALTSMGMTWEEKNYKIWVSGYWGVLLFWRLHFLVSATQFPKSNDTFNVAPWVLTLDIYLGEGCRLRQPSQAATLFPVENFMSPIYLSSKRMFDE